MTALFLSTVTVLNIAGRRVRDRDIIVMVVLKSFLAEQLVSLKLKVLTGTRKAGPTFPL